MVVGKEHPQLAEGDLFLRIQAHFMVRGGVAETPTTREHFRRINGITSFISQMDFRQQ